MNRRTFLLAIGASACERATKPLRRPAEPRSAPDHAESVPIVDRRPHASQLRASALALHGEVLFHFVGDDLDKLDAASLRRLDTWTVTPRQFCVVEDGSLLVFALVHDSVKSAVYRIDAHGNLETFSGPILTVDGPNTVIRGAASDEIYVAEGDHLLHLKLRGREAEQISRIPHPPPNDTSREQLVGRGDGSVVGPGAKGGVAVVTPAGQVLEYPTADRFVMHIAGASSDRVWYSYAGRPNLETAQRLVLASAQRPMSEIAKLDVAPGRIVHVGSGGGAAVALVLDADMAKQAVSWTVVVVEESGSVRWRAPVPPTYTENFSLTAGFVAIDEHHVILASSARVLVAWDATTGKVVS